MENSKLKFYDTNIFLDNLEEVKINNFFLISSMTLKELENIKTSNKKDEDVKFKARKATRWLKENQNRYCCVPVTQDLFTIIDKVNLDISNDNIIMACAKKMTFERIDVTFVTNDLSCFNIAKSIFKLNTVMGEVNDIKDDYKGYKEATLSDGELAKWYQDKKNLWNLINNEYLLIKDIENQIIDQYRFYNNQFLPIRAKDLKSSFLGKFKPLDKYQLLAVDSLTNNKLTMLKGKPGSGKSLIAMNYLFSELEKGRIEQIIVFVNAPKVRGSVELGYYKGSKTEKLLDSQIGSFLSCKLGSMTAVEELLEDTEEGNAKLVLLPMSDIRGIDLSGKKYGVLITEAQNTTIDLMKLAIQRVGSESFMILDGDFETQVDDRCYEGKNNGMRRVSEVFRGCDLYGEVELNKIYRSELAKIADLM